jgi:hypothetical protein
VAKIASGAAFGLTFDLTDGNVLAASVAAGATYSGLLNVEYKYFPDTCQGYGHGSNCSVESPKTESPASITLESVATDFTQSFVTNLIAGAIGVGAESAYMQWITMGDSTSLGALGQQVGDIFSHEDSPLSTWPVLKQITVRRLAKTVSNMLVANPLLGELNKIYSGFMQKNQSSLSGAGAR